ncbi:hypothetical protein MKK68_26200 [Methylobacterium sp. E-016]|uniref:hypothetical protein n=1 Tax=Methylobacterium sp. E-016 TaxID=2836556 RepID=UPI001FBBDF1B|nr:hypothetical protein [Methylobacterium sp. E-016]MCJ2079082.1 hypothetical protein [Methylobacterium sp. E-016]
MSERIPATVTAVENTPTTSPAKLIVFGLDDGGKPHASQFAQSDTELATKAAGLMGMRTLAVETDEHRALGAPLPQGRVFASGKGFVSFVKKGLYERLSALAGPAMVSQGTADAGNLAARHNGLVATWQLKSIVRRTGLASSLAAPCSFMAEAETGGSRPRSSRSKLRTSSCYAGATGRSCRSSCERWNTSP